MMAMTSSPDMAAFGRRNGCDGGCHGCYGGGSSCYGGSGCHGCTGGGGCHGGRKARGCHGGRGGCHGCTGGGCHGCYGGGCYGGGCHGYTAYCGCHGGAVGCWGGGCWGGAAAPAAPAQPAPAPMPKPPGGTSTPPKTDVRLPASATIVVSLPEGATLMVDGAATRSTAAVRTFSTPTLNAGKNYFYTLTAEIVRDGQKLSVSEQVTVRAGETTNVSLPDSKFAQTIALQ